MSGDFSEGSMIYDATRRVFGEGEVLRFDDHYRLAQLPLVAPGHPLIIERVAGRDYVNGRYDRERFSLVAPISWEVLGSAAGYRAFVDDLGTASFSSKISDEITERRKDRLHATISGGLAEDKLEDIEALAGRFTRDQGPLRVRALGPFLGRKNTGRIYLPVISETMGGEQRFGRLQRALGLPVTGFYAIGLFNFFDELDVAETRELKAFLNEWQDRVLLETSIEQVQIIGTHDDLVLSGRVLGGTAVAQGWHGGGTPIGA